MTAALYIHIPFCEIRCGYCDFFTVTGREEQIPAYLSALEREIALCLQEHAEHALTFETLYFGGGTPSLLSAGQLESLISTALAKFNFAPNPEITLEANPATLDLAKLRELRAVGINRLSLGVQSFHPKELHFLDRDHTVTQAITNYEQARQAGYDNISIDLIFGLPKQTQQAWQENLKRAAALAPDHISAYNLSFEDGTPLTTQLQAGKIKRAPEERQRRMLLATIEYLREHGLQHYEISNYARPGLESRHNQKYWDGSPYLGLGVSSHSYVNGRRFWNVRNLKTYLDKLHAGELAIAGAESLDQETRSFELVYLGLRRRTGVALQRYEIETGDRFIERHRRTLAKFFDHSFDDESTQTALTQGAISLGGELLEFAGGHLRLTDAGVVLCDAICAEFLS